MNKTTSSVITRNGKQLLTVNGREIDSVAYITYIPENNRYEDFAKAGYSLFPPASFLEAIPSTPPRGWRSFRRVCLIWDTSRIFHILIRILPIFSPYAPAP